MTQSELSLPAVKQRYGTPSNLRGLWALGRDLGLLTVAMMLAVSYGDRGWVAIALIWCIGLLQFAMGESLLHEASHGSLFQQKQLNLWVGRVIGWSIFTTLAAWQAEHRVHHTRLLSSQDHLTADYVSYGLYKGLHPTIIWIFQPLCGVVGWQWIVGEMPSVFREKGIFIFYSVLGLFCYATHSLDILFLYWLLPLVWVYSSILYWSEITDHYLAQSETRSNYSWLWNLLFHNGGYHWLHHQYPFIPGHLLKRADAELTPTTADCVSGWWQMYRVIFDAAKASDNVLDEVLCGGPAEADIPGPCP